MTQTPSARRRWLILAVLATSQMIVNLDATIINTAIPAIKRAFELSESQSLWIADAYLVIFGGLLLLAGALGDRFGRRRMLMIGMAVFVIASIGVAFSPDANFLIVGRGLQGLGGALVIPQTLSILTAVFPREERSKAFGIWAGAMGFGLAFGPLIGGVLIDLIGWSAVFWAPAPIAGVALLGMTVVPESRSLVHTRLDLPGALTGTVGMVAIVFAIIEGIQRGWSDPLIVGAFILAAVALSSFILIERRTPQPLLPMAFFKQRDFTGAMIGMFFIMFALMGVMFYLPQFFQLVQGTSATTSGLRLMPLALAMMVVAPLAGRILPRIGPRIIMLWAPAVHGGGCLLLLSFVLDVDTPYWIIGLALGWLGIGGAMHMPATTDTSMAAVPVDLAGKASAVTTSGQELGGTLSIAILGSFAATVYATGIRDSLAPLELAASQIDTIAAGVGSAYQVIAGLETSLIPAVQAAVSESFVDAIQNTYRFGIIFAVCSGIVCWILVPSRQRRQQAATLQGTAGFEAAPPALAASPAAGDGPPAGAPQRVLTAARSIALPRPQKTGVP